MSRPFSFARFAAFYLAALSCAQSRPAVNPGSLESERALAVGDALLDDEFAQSPEFVALLRPPRARYDTLDDASLAAVAAREDLLACDRCGGRRVVLAFLSEGSVVKAILEHLGLPTTGPPLAPARGSPQTQFAPWPDDSPSAK